MKKFDFKQAATKVVGVGTGALGARVIQTQVLQRIAPNLKPAISGAALVALGVFVPSLMGKKNEMMESIGDGIVATGMLTLGEAVAPAVFSAGSTTQPVEGIGDLDEDGFTVDTEFSDTPGVGEQVDDALLAGPLLNAGDQE